jgi:hypothetical protein
MFHRLPCIHRGACRFVVHAATAGLVVAGAVVLHAEIGSASTGSVTNCNDSGAGSLRAAVAAANNATIETIAVPAGADLAVSLSAPWKVQPRSTFEYTVKVTNKGPGQALGVSTFLFLSSDVEIQSASKDPVALTDELSWAASSLAPQGSLTYRVVVQVEKKIDDTTLTGVATVGATGTLDPNPVNNMASVTTEVMGRSHNGRWR